MTSTEHPQAASAVGDTRREGWAPGVDLLPDPVVVMDDDGVLLHANAATAEALEWQVSEFLGRPLDELVHPDDLNSAGAAVDAAPLGGTGDLFRIRVRAGDGSWRSLELRGARHRSDDGTEVIALVCRDVSGRHLHDLAPEGDEREAAVLRAVMANMHGMVAILEPDLVVRSINGEFTRRLGHSPVRAASRPFVEFLHPDDRVEVADAIARLAPDKSVSLDARFVVEDDTIENIDDDNAVVTCEFTVNNLTDDAVLSGYVICGQVSPGLRDARDRVDFLAEHDHLTGLRNRNGFMRHAHDMLRRGGGLGLMVIDVTQFRSINELYGERVGDRVLAALAARIDEIRSPELVVARFGGDEFVMAVRSSSEAEIRALRDRVRREVNTSVDVDGQEIVIALRTAIAFESSPQGLESLLASASNELMRAKRNADPEAGGISFDAITARRRQLDQLRGALESDQIQPYFQPIVAVDGHITAFEALVRWVHPVRGLLDVTEILPLARMAGLMRAIDDRVLELSFAFARRLAEAGHGAVEVHVNVDPNVIAQPAFASSFLHHCSAVGADPSQIVVEITETDLLAPGAVSLDNMRELRRAGAHVSIDDFGTGYSSLAHLLELPVDGVKIDRRFVVGIDVDPTATNLTTAILGLSESLQLSCVAEGVEQPYQRDRLADMGCNAFQGWLFSRAVGADEAAAMLPRVGAVAAPQN